MVVLVITTPVLHCLEKEQVPASRADFALLLAKKPLSSMIQRSGLGKQ